MKSLIDKVLQECIYSSKGMVINTLDYLSDKSFLIASKVPFKTDSLLVPNTKHFFHLLSSVFVNSIIRKKLTDVEFENQKDLFLESADMKQIILALNIKKNGEKVILVTEETESSNDNKLFKKIPAICRELQIETLTLPELFEKYDGINIDFQ